MVSHLQGGEVAERGADSAACGLPFANDAPSFAEAGRDMHALAATVAGGRLRYGLAGPTGARSLPWLVRELESSAAWKAGREGAGDGVCSGVNSVDEWFVGAGS